jgi:hypothetical protein
MDFPPTLLARTRIWEILRRWITEKRLTDISNTTARMHFPIRLPWVDEIYFETSEKVDNVQQEEMGWEPLRVDERFWNEAGT